MISSRLSISVQPSERRSAIRVFWADPTVKGRNQIISVKQKNFNILLDALIPTLSIWVPESIKR